MSIFTLKIQKASEDEKARLVRFTEEKNNQILHYNNKLAQLQTRLDQVRISIENIL